MASKSTKTTKSSAKTSSKSTSGKSSAPKKTTSPATKSKTTPAKKASSPAKNQPARSTAGKQKSTPEKSKPQEAQPRTREWLTLNRTLDILGVIAVFLGVVVLLSMLSAANSAVTGWILSFFRSLLGVGVYVFPLIMIPGGLWLILRNFDRIPQLSATRAVGLILLYLWFLTFVQFVYSVWISPEIAPYDLAAAGQGGGYLGAAFYSLLTRILGVGGAAIALLAWLLIALILSLDVTLDELFRRISAAFASARRKIPAGSGRSAGTLPNPNSAANGQSRPAGQPQETSTFLGDEPFLPIPPLPGAAAYQPTSGVQYVQAAWVLPSISQILEPGVELDRNDEADLQRAHVIEETLAAFGAPVKVVEINRGPTITQFGVEPDFIETRTGRTRVRVGKIASLTNDLALALSARTIRVEAPVPGKGFVGIEVPNDEIALVALRDVLESEAFKRLKSPLRFALGQNVSGSAVAADLAVMPHLLVAGQTGSGKSVMVNSLICCMLANNTPDDLRLVMVDPKRVELTGYNGIPHLLAPVIVELERVISALQWVAREMDMRYRKLAEAGSRNIQDYNNRMTASGQKRLPHLVVIIDELADLMMLAPDETERTITRLAQLARATGIHLVIATQRPSVDVVTGLIKANFPARIAFAVASGVDSRVILDQPGAETLLGRGDMLFQAPDAPAPVRLQGVFVSDSEIQRLVAYWQSFSGLVEPAPTAISGVVDDLPGGLPLKQMSFWESGNGAQSDDPLLSEAIDLARRQGRASVSMLQRRLRIGYTRAARLVETMEERGIVGPPEGGTGVREILDYGPAAPPIDDG